MTSAIVPPEPAVRLADSERPADLEQLRLLEREARTAALDVRGGARWIDEHAPVGEGWSARCAVSTVLVAHIEAVLVGYLVLDIDGDVARVDQVWVTPQARELGFGDELLAEAMRRGRTAGARLVEGAALPGDRMTKNLYERAGIVARLIITSKAL